MNDVVYKKKKYFPIQKDIPYKQNSSNLNEIKVKENFYNVNGKLYNANRKYTMLIEN